MATGDRSSAELDVLLAQVESRINHWSLRLQQVEVEITRLRTNLRILAEAIEADIRSYDARS